MSPLWQALSVCIESLMQQRAELVQLLVAEHEARIDALGNSGESSATGRKQYADVTAAHLHSEVLKLSAEVKINEDLRDFLTLAINADVLPPVPAKPLAPIPATYT